MHAFDGFTATDNKNGKSQLSDMKKINYGAVAVKKVAI